MVLFLKNVLVVIKKFFPKEIQSFIGNEHSADFLNKLATTRKFVDFPIFNLLKSSAKKASCIIARQKSMTHCTRITMNVILQALVALKN